VAQIARPYGVHRATAVRWLSDAPARLIASTRTALEGGSQSIPRHRAASGRARQHRPCKAPRKRSPHPKSGSLRVPRVGT